jgi:hypothetical protein
LNEHKKTVPLGPDLDQESEVGKNSGSKKVQSVGLQHHPKRVGTNLGSCDAPASGRVTPGGRT